MTNSTPPSILSCLIAPLFFLGTAEIVDAQTAEETVVYMMHGISKDTITVRRDQTFTFGPVPEGHGLEFKVDGSLVMSVHYEQIDGCHYKVTFSEADGPNQSHPLKKKIEATLDWSGVSSVTLTTPPNARPGDPIQTLNVEGLAIDQCVSTHPQECKSLNSQEFVRTAFNFGNPARTIKAYEYFRANFCKGAAF